MTQVSGTYLLPGDPDTPATGFVRFILSVAAVDTSGNQRTPGPDYAQLDAAGSFSIDLVPDSALVVDGDAVYEVAEYVGGRLLRDPWFLHLADTEPVDLPSRYPGTAYSPAAVLPVPGPQGEQGEQGEVGPIGPEGPPGGAVLSSWWQYITADPAADPGSGNITATEGAAIGDPVTVAIHHTDADGVAQPAGTASPGDELWMRDTSANYWKLAVTAATVNGTWSRVDGTLEAATAEPPRRNERVQISLVHPMEAYLTQEDADELYEPLTPILDQAVWHVDAGTLTPGGDGLADRSGNGRDAMFGAGAAAPVVLDYSGETYLHIPAAGQGAQITTAGALPYTATRKDGSTVTGTTPAGTWLFDTAGDWTRIATDDGAHILDPADAAADYATITNTGSAGGNWTIIRAASGFKTAVVTRPVLLFGGGQYAQAASGPPKTAEQTMLFAGRAHGTITANEAYADIGDSGSADGRYYLQRQHLSQDTVRVRYYTPVDSGGTATASSTDLPTSAIAGARVSAGSVQAYANGIWGTEKAAGETPWGGNTITVGAIISGAAGWTGEFLGAVIFDRALTDDEVARAAQELQGVPHSQQPDPHHGYPPLIEGSIPSALPSPTRVGSLATFDDGTAAIRTATGWQQITTTPLTGAPPT